MHSDDSLRKTGDHTEDFEAELEALVLTAFARGASVEGTWEFSVPAADAPGWRVTVEKVRPTDADGSDAVTG